MNASQQRFVDEYLVDLNATQAAIRAGYSAKTAEQQGPRLLGNAGVAAGIAAAIKARSERTHITQDRVLQELARVALFDIRKLYREDGSLKAPHELDDDSAAALSGIEVVEEFGEGPSDEIESQPHGGGLKRRRTLVGFTKKVKLWDKPASLTLAMRHLGMLIDRTELTGKNGAPLPVGINSVVCYLPAKEVSSLPAPPPSAPD